MRAVNNRIGKVHEWRGDTKVALFNHQVHARTLSLNNVAVSSLTPIRLHVDNDSVQCECIPLIARFWNESIL